jgi:hypothetical protein
MKNEFETIYGENVKKTGFQPADQAEPAEEAPEEPAPEEELTPEEELAPAA